jgi:hypothetical protein
VRIRPHGKRPVSDAEYGKVFPRTQEIYKTPIKTGIFSISGMAVYADGPLGIPAKRTYARYGGDGRVASWQ